MLLRMYAGSFLSIAARYVLVAVAPLVFIHWGVSASKAGILVGLAFLVQMLASPALGKFADKRGRKVALLFGAGMMALGGVIIFLFPSMPGFVIGQILFGLGPAAFFAAAFASVADAAPVDKRGSVIGRFGILINVAEAIAPPIGLWMGYVGRPWGFGVAALLSLLAIPMFASLQSRSTSEAPHAITAQEEPFLPKSWWLPLSLTGCMATSYGVINAYLPQRAILVHGNAGWFFVANFGIQIVLRLVAHKTLDRWNRSILLASGAILMAVSTVLLAYFVGNIGLLMLGTVYGIGTFYVTPSLVAWLIGLSEARKGFSMAAYNSAFGTGTALGAMVLGPLFTFLHLAGAVFWAAGLLSAVGVIGLSHVREMKKSTL